MINNLDFDKGLEIFGGKKEDYFKVLRSYMASTRTKIDLLENFDKNNLKQYEITVHGIKGTSFGIGAGQIGNSALGLEKAAASGDLDYIAKNNPAFLEALKNLVRELEDFFRGIDSGKIRQKKDKPDIKTLLKLRCACEIYDMKEADDAMAELDAYEYSSDGGLVAWLKKNTEEMQYEQIAEKLNEFLNTVQQG